MASTSNRLHWLPCSIGHDGPAPVNEYFRPVKTGTSGDLVVEDATLRGRRLVGATYQLPEGYVAYVLPKGQTHQDIVDVESDDNNDDAQHSLLGLPPPTSWKSASASASSAKAKSSSGGNGGGSGGGGNDDDSTSSSASVAQTSLTYWKLDEHPTPQDGQRRALDWVSTARSVAAHVGRDEVEAAMKG